MKLSRDVFAKHIAVKLSNDVNAICQPLQQHFNIDCFFFQRDFCNIETGTQEAIAPLCNNVAAAEFTACNYEDTEPVPLHLNRQSHYYLNATHSPKWVAAMQQNCHLHHFITKSERVTDNVWDRFVFATSEPDQKYLDFYLNNRHLLDNFVTYFKEKAAKFITLATTQTIQSGHTAIVIDESITNSTNTANFLHAVVPQHYRLVNSNGVEIRMPAAEMRCLFLLAQGRSIKEIGNQLGISPRTVETNLVRSKNRLNCYSKKELLDILEFNRLNPGFLTGHWANS